jgi:chemotaxis protein MotB
MTDDLTSTKPSRLPWLLFGGAVVATVVAGSLAWMAHERSATAATALDDTTKQLEEAKTANTALEARIAELEGQLANVTAKSDELQANLEATAAELAKLKEDTGALEDQLKSEIAKGEIQVKQLGQRIQVDLVDRVLFDSGEATLSTRGQEVLGRVAAVLQTIEDKQIQVSGHTDDIPIKNEELKKLFPTNWELSSARAVNVVRFLSETGGVKRERLTAAGYGEYHPIASNATPKGRAKNRRIEILLTPSLDAKKTALATPKPAAAATPVAADKPK